MYYKGHDEVKVDIVLLLIANNCWTRSFALGYWLFYFSSVFFDSDEEKNTLAGKRLSQVSMYVVLFTLALVGDSQFLWQLVIILCRTNLLLGQSWWGKWYWYLSCLCLYECITSWGVHIMLFGESSWIALIVQYHILAVSLVFGKICKIWHYWVVCTYTSVLHRFFCLLETWMARVPKVAVVSSDCPVL
jgi:hypothetical protein